MLIEEIFLIFFPFGGRSTEDRIDLRLVNVGSCQGVAIVWHAIVDKCVKDIELWRVKVLCHDSGWRTRGLEEQMASVWHVRVVRGRNLTSSIPLRSGRGVSTSDSSHSPSSRYSSIW